MFNVSLAKLENDFGSKEVCEDRIHKYVVPCLASLAAASQDDATWKDMNYQILLKTRHEDPKVDLQVFSYVSGIQARLDTQFIVLFCRNVED